MAIGGVRFVAAATTSSATTATTTADRRDRTTGTASGAVMIGATATTATMATTIMTIAIATATEDVLLPRAVHPLVRGVACRTTVQVRATGTGTEHHHARHRVFVL